MLSIEIAFTQWLFKCLREKPISAKGLNIAYSATSSLLFAFNKEVVTKLPVVCFLALLIW